MKEIKYIIGDATNPSVNKGEYSVICHCCNTLGAWGAGFVIPLGKRYPSAKQNYMAMIKTYGTSERLGKVGYAKVNSNIVVANIMGQERIYTTSDGKIPLDYDALKEGFVNVYNKFSQINVPFTIHMPRIGCGLAGGKWEKVAKIIKDVFLKNNVDVFVYDLK